MTPVLSDGPRVMRCCAMRWGCLHVLMTGEGRGKGSGRDTVHNDSCKGRCDPCFPYCDRRKTASA